MQPPEAHSNQGPKSHRAYFEMPCLVAAELRFRVEACGEDGILLEHCYTLRKDDKELSIQFRCDIETVRTRITRALRYIRGWKRKRVTYSEWRRRGWAQKRKCICGVF